MPLWIKETTWFQFSCCAWGCQKGLLKREEKKRRFRGWELCVSLWSEQPQNIHTPRSIPVEHFNSSSVHDKVYIMICKVLWEGEILWQENSLPPTRRLSVSPFSPARSCSPLSSLSLSHCFFISQPQKTNDVWLNVFESHHFMLWWYFSVDRCVLPFCRVQRVDFTLGSIKSGNTLQRKWTLCLDKSFYLCQPHGGLIDSII